MNPNPQTPARVAKLIDVPELEYRGNGVFVFRGRPVPKNEMFCRILDAMAKKFRNVELYYSKANGGWHVELMDFDNSTDISGPTRQTRLDAMLSLVSVMPEDVL